MNQTNPSRCGILYIDDEEKALKYFRMAFASKFTIHTAASGEEGLALLRREAGNIGVVISDQRMPGMIGAEVLGSIREEFPCIVRLLTTAYSDLESAILAVNKGHIYQYVVKPWDVSELEMILQRAADYHHVLSERNELLRLKMSALQRILCCDRVKWLLLMFGHGTGARAAAFRKALGALLRALSSFPAPRPAPERAFGLHDFDATTLISREYHAGVALVDYLKESVMEGPIPAECQDVVRLGESGELLAAGLGMLISILPRDVPATVEIDDGVRLTLSSSSDFSGELSSLLFSPDPGQVSGLLLKSLWNFAEAGIPLSVDVGGAGQPVLQISLSLEDISAEDVIEALRGIFEAWDLGALSAHR